MPLAATLRSEVQNPNNVATTFVAWTLEDILHEKIRSADPHRKWIGKFAFWTLALRCCARTDEEIHVRPPRDVKPSKYCRSCDKLNLRCK